MINLSKNDYNPAPIQYDESTGNYLWIIKEYKIWAKSYQEALLILPLMQQSCTQSYSDY